MRKRERYKHLLNLFANFVMLVAETAMFAFIWYKMDHMGNLFRTINVCAGIGG